MVGVGVIEAFGEAVDEDARVGGFDFDFWVRPVVVVDREEDVASGAVGIVAERSVFALPSGLVRAVYQVVPDH